MKLKKVVLENFRSLRQRTIIDIEDKITAFIGVNDSGKSSVLEALDFSSMECRSKTMYQ